MLVPATYREPLCPLKVLPLAVSCLSMHNIRDHYPSFIAHAGSCARPNSSCHLDFTLDPQVFAGCCESLLEDGPSRHYLRNPCVGAWTPTPQRPFSAFARFFLKDNGLTLDVRGSARRNCPCNATSTGYFSRGCSHSFMFRLPSRRGGTRPPGCTHR